MNKNETLVRDLYKWCVKNNLWDDNCIYYDNKAVALWPEWSGVEGKKIADRLYEYENKNPRDFFREVILLYQCRLREISIMC